MCQTEQTEIKQSLAHRDRLWTQKHSLGHMLQKKIVGQQVVFAKQGALADQTWQDCVKSFVSTRV